MQYGLAELADTASTYLMRTRFDKLTPEQVRVIPTAEAYQKVILLQQHRKSEIKTLLTNSELFPFGYGACPTHAKIATTRWNDERAKLQELVEAGTSSRSEIVQSTCVHASSDTDIAAEMLSRLEDT